MIFRLNRRTGRRILKRAALPADLAGKTFLYYLNIGAMFSSPEGKIMAGNGHDYNKAVCL